MIEKTEKFNESPVRVITDELENTWFAGIDVCSVLGYADSYQKITKSLDEDEYKLDRIKDGQGHKKDTLTVNEFGLYKLILSSTKPEAKKFQRWVTHEVLPSIRKAGKYSTDNVQQKEAEIQQIVKEIEDLETKSNDLKTKAKELDSKKRDLEVKLRKVLKTDPNQYALDL